MNVALKREIEQWVSTELRTYALENKILPVKWWVSVESKETFVRTKMVHPLEHYQPIPVFDGMSEICLHIRLRKEEKEADKLLFLAPFWEEEQPMIKEVIKLLFKVLQSEIVTEYV